MFEKPQVGDIVYEPYNPTRIGVIIKITEGPRPGRSYPHYVVRFMDGTEDALVSLKSLKDLIFDHERKLATHKAAMEKAMEFRDTLTDIWPQSSTG